jgi:hypothetical protein
MCRFDSKRSVHPEPGAGDEKSSLEEGGAEARNTHGGEFRSDPDRSGSQTESGARLAMHRNFAPNFAQTRNPDGSLHRGVVLTTEPLAIAASLRWLPGQDDHRTAVLFLQALTAA